MDQYDEELKRDAGQLIKSIITKDELTLERLAMVRISRTLWSLDWVKKELINIAKTDAREYDVLWRKSEPDTYFALLKRLEECCYFFRLPQISVALLQDTIEDMGTQIFWFLPHFLTKMKIPETSRGEKRMKNVVESYVNNLHWTDSGRIDYEMTLKIIIDKKLIYDKSMELSELCTNCSEEKILIWLSQFDDGSLNFFHRKLKRYLKKVQPFSSDLVAYWLWRYHRKQKDQNDTLDFISFYESYFSLIGDQPGIPYDIRIEINLPVDVNMLLICAKNGFHLGVKYFWSRLNQNSQTRHFIETFTSSFGNPDFWYLSGSRMDITIFLLRRMSLECCCHLLDALRKGEISSFKSITLLTRTWRDFTFPLLDVFKKYVPNSPRFYTDTSTQVFEALLYLLFKSNEQTYRKMKLKKLAFEILKKCPEVINYTRENDKTLIYEATQKVTIYRLLYSNEIPLIKAFINHKSMLHWRDTFLIHAADHYFRIQSSQKENNGHGRFIEFEQSVLLNKNEREQFSYVISQMRGFANTDDMLQ